jgi:ketosteroid isomerase-like protein
MRNRLAMVLLLFASIVLQACTMWREHAVVNNWAEATGGEGLERSFWKDMKARDWNTLQRHLAGNFVSVTPEEGRLDRAATLQHYEPLKLDDYSLADFQVEMNGNTLVVTYSITMHGTYAGQPLPTAPERMMTVWQQQKAGWLAIAHTVMGPEK